MGDSEGSDDCEESGNNANLRTISIAFIANAFEEGGNRRSTRRFKNNPWEVVQDIGVNAHHLGKSKSKSVAKQMLDDAEFVDTHAAYDQWDNLLKGMVGFKQHRKKQNDAASKLTPKHNKKHKKIAASSLGASTARGRVKSKSSGRAAKLPQTA